jgi:hypothetical protein
MKLVASEPEQEFGCIWVSYRFNLMTFGSIMTCVVTEKYQKNAFHLLDLNVKIVRVTAT